MYNICNVYIHCACARVRKHTHSIHSTARIKNAFNRASGVACKINLKRECTQCGDDEGGSNDQLTNQSPVFNSCVCSVYYTYYIRTFLQIVHTEWLVVNNNNNKKYITRCTRTRAHQTFTILIVIIVVFFF